MLLKLLQELYPLEWLKKLFESCQYLNLMFSKSSCNTVLLLSQAFYILCLHVNNFEDHH